MTLTMRPSIHHRICPCCSTRALIKRIFLAGFIVLAAWLGGANRWQLHAQAICPSPYIVQAGDSWTGIAKKCGVSFPDLRATNAQLWSQRGVKIQPGDTMALPIVDKLPKTPAEAAPVATIRAYYAALAQALRQSGDLNSAYAYFSSVRRAEEPLARFRKAYAQTTQVKIEYIKLIEQQATTAQVGVIVTTIDLEQGQQKHHQYDVIYPLVLEAGVWRIGKTAQYDEIGALSQGFLNGWLDARFLPALPSDVVVEIWHSNTIRTGQASLTYQFTIFSLDAELNDVEIELTLIGADGQKRTEQLLTIKTVGGTTASSYQNAIITVSNQLKVQHFQLGRATAQVDGKLVNLLANLRPVTFQPLPMVADR